MFRITNLILMDRKYPNALAYFKIEVVIRVKQKLWAVKIWAKMIWKQPSSLCKTLGKPRVLHDLDTPRVEWPYIQWQPIKESYNIIIPNLIFLVNSIINIWMFKVVLCQRSFPLILRDFSVQQTPKMPKS